MHALVDDMTLFDVELALIEMIVGLTDVDSLNVEIECSGDSSYKSYG